MGKINTPSLSQKEVVAELAYRTGLSKKMVDLVFEEMMDIVMTGILSGVYVTIPYIGKAKFKDIMPAKEYEVTNPFTKVVKKVENAPGYRKITLSSKQAIRDSIKEKTFISYEEFAAMEDKE